MDTKDDTINRLLEAVSFCRTVEALCAEAAAIAGEALRADQVIVYLIDTMRLSTKRMAAWGAEFTEDPYGRVFNHPTFFKSARRITDAPGPIAGGSALKCDEKALNTEMLSIIHGKAGIRQFLWQPVSFRDPAYVLLTVNRLKGGQRWGRKDCSFLTTFAGYLRMAFLIFLSAEGFRKSLEDLKIQKSLYESVVEDQTELICRYLPDGTLTFVNGAYVRFFRKKREELIGSNFLFHLHPDDRAGAVDLLGSLRDDMPLRTSERRAVLADGSVRWLQWVDRVILDEKGRLVEMQAVGRDVTDQRRLERELMHARKMEAIGTMAGGIAHDFNNFLTAISGCAKILAMEIDKSRPLGECVEKIITVSDRAAAIVRGLLSFSRKGSQHKSVININNAVSEAKALLSSVVGNRIEIRTDLSGEDLLVMADSTGIIQVLVNLGINARDAMPSGGTIRIETASVLLGDRDMQAWGDSAPGPYALLRVTDNGIGMDESTRERIFEPFFTTKDTGKGTGLGLSIAYGFAKEHGGRITCASEPGRGTTFSLYIPLSGARSEKWKTLWTTES
ncbi:MAG TPA: ATP-binding protein [Dissulfurispiraceae bacterium]|nr:ATP-binding protein [Dissulfurispiraceae bacterium]